MQFVFVHENNWYKAFLKSLCCMTIFILFFSKVNHITGVTQQINVKTRISWLERSTTSVWSLFFLRLTGGGGLFFALSSLTAHNSRLGNLVVTASFTFNFVDWADKEIGKKLQLLLYKSSSVRNLDTNLIIFITPRQREGLFLFPPNSSNVRKKNLKAQQILELSWLCLSLTPHWLFWLTD